MPKKLASPAELYEVAKTYTPDAWLQVLMQSINGNTELEFAMPTFPPEDLQRMFVGSSSEHALLEGSAFYREIQLQLDKLGFAFSKDSRVLDFGVGWGRYMRFFYRNVPWDNLYGIDPWDLAINVCRETKIYGQLIKSNLLPPTFLRDNSFDVAFAYSVFSHLSPAAGMQWIEEIARLLKPGGILLVTTQGRSFIDFCAALRDKPYESPWHKALANSFSDPDKARQQYDAGEMLYAANSGGPALPGEIYGDAIIPKAYIQSHWSRYLEFISFTDDRRILPQALIVMRKAG